VAPNHRESSQLSPAIWLVLLACGGLVGAGCKAKVPAITEPFTEAFERAELGPDWLDTSGQGRIEGGKLKLSEGYNKPLWLRRKLPESGVIELDVTSNSPEGDIKIEAWGDGESFDPDRGAYESTAYVFVFGGWGNRRSIIGRLGEHDEAEKAHRTEPAVEPGRVYHWTITRNGSSIDWKIDGQPFLAFQDPQPLNGDRHAFLGITNWQSKVVYDNLQVRPLP
jgi:hypothetical protein